jgi:transcriptional regulator with XRE-family HTH domain
MAKKRFKKSIGGRIKYARVTADLSQKDLAKKIKLSDKAVSAYEVDRALPSLIVLKKIGKATKRPVRYFLDDASREEDDLQFKLKKIEQELTEVKKLLLKRQRQDEDEVV